MARTDSVKSLMDQITTKANIEQAKLPTRQPEALPEAGLGQLAAVSPRDRNVQTSALCQSAGRLLRARNAAEAKSRGYG